MLSRCVEYHHNGEWARITYKPWWAEAIAELLFEDPEKSKRFSLRKISAREALFFDDEELREKTQIFNVGDEYKLESFGVYQMKYNPSHIRASWLENVSPVDDWPERIITLTFTGDNDRAIAESIGADFVHVSINQETNKKTAVFEREGDEEELSVKEGETIALINGSLEVLNQKDFVENYIPYRKELLQVEHVACISKLAERMREVFKPTMSEEEYKYKKSLEDAKALIETELERLKKGKNKWQI